VEQQRQLSGSGQRALPYGARRSWSMSKMLREFKEFAMKGSVVDLAVGLIVGGAFGKIVDSLVKDIMMPPLGLVLKGVDFSNLKVVLLPAKSAGTTATLALRDGTLANAGTTVTQLLAGAATTANATEEVAIRYGQFLNTLIHFLIVSFAVYLLVKQINRLKTQLEKPTLTTRECPRCTSIISIRATRCPQCTADIAAVGENAPKTEQPQDEPTNSSNSQVPELGGT
jgi:large conductance mechanosensitive channel